MAATAYSALIQAARFHINAARGSGATYKTDKFWSDDELLNIALRGTTDLWAALIDLNEEHYLTIDATNVSIAADATSLTGVPADTFRIYLIEPRDISDTGSTRDVRFVPKDYNDQYFIDSRAWGSTDPTSPAIIFYALTGQGAPNAAPTVLVAPTLSSAMNLRFVYIPTLGVHNYTLTSPNPIPGESDHALIAWTVAYARGKEREDKLPDAGWLAVYQTEKQSLLTRMQPRQVQEPEYVDGMFRY